jgi:hypothetical protein
MTVYSVSFRTIRVPKIVVLVDAATLRKAERLIESCEHCNPDGAEMGQFQKHGSNKEPS